MSSSSRVNDIIEQNNLQLPQVYVADLCRLSWRGMPRNEAQPTHSKFEKDKLSVLLCANADDSHRLKPLVVTKGKLSIYHELSQIPLLFCTQDKAQISNALFWKWLRHSFHPAVAVKLRLNRYSENTPILLLIRNYWPDAYLGSIEMDNITVHFLQPFDIENPHSSEIIGKNFVIAYKNRLLKRFNQQKGSIYDFQKGYKLEDAVFGVSLSWNDVTSQLISYSWFPIWPKGMFLNEENSAEFEGFESNDTSAVIDSSLTTQIPEKAIKDWLESTQGCEESESDDEEASYADLNLQVLSVKSAMKDILTFTEKQQVLSIQEVMKYMLKWKPSDSTKIKCEPPF